MKIFFYEKKYEVGTKNKGRPIGAASRTFDRSPISWEIVHHVVVEG